MAPRIFVSHSSKDIEIVRRILDLIEAALLVEPGDIRCTSLPGYKLSGGDRTSDRVRAEIDQAAVLLAIITRKSFASAWVLFEMGARWGLGKRILPLLGPGIEASVLHGPVQDLNAFSCSVKADLEQMLGDLARFLALDLRSRGHYEKALQSVLELKERLTGPENETRIRDFFRKHPDHWYYPEAAVGAELGIEREIVRVIVDRLSEEGYLKHRVGQFGREYRLS